MKFNKNEKISNNPGHNFMKVKFESTEMALLMPIVIKQSVLPRLTVTLNMIITEVASNVAHPRIMGRGAR